MATDADARDLTRPPHRRPAWWAMWAMVAVLLLLYAGGIRDLPLWFAFCVAGISYFSGLAVGKENARHG